MKEYLEKNWAPDLTEADAVLLTVKALLEVSWRFLAIRDDDDHLLLTLCARTRWSTRGARIWKSLS